MIKKKEIGSWMKKCSRQVKQIKSVTHLDFYGKTLGFHYDGADKMRSCTGALISLFVFFAIVMTSLSRLAMQINERYQSFTRHNLNNYFEGMASSNDRQLHAPAGAMTSE